MPHPDDSHLARYAVRSVDSSSRTHSEPEDPLRGPFELDRHRIVESTAFRRLEGKTQVFTPEHHDHFRTRLTHTLEVSGVARCLARGLRANESLVEAISLAHDLGHPPFGHAGEAALNEALSEHGGFNHNTHTLRVVTYLEHPFRSFRGLNLTAETRAGLAAHDTPYDTPHGDRASAEAGPTVEALIASIADRIAYACHDLEDAIGAGFVTLDDLSTLFLWQDAFRCAGGDPHEDNVHRVRRVALDALLDSLIADVMTASRGSLDALRSPGEIRACAVPPVALSGGMDAALRHLEMFLETHLYRQPQVASMDARGRRMVLELFDAYRSKPRELPARFGERIGRQGVERVVCDYIAGMTDRFCTAQHERHVGGG